MIKHAKKTTNRIFDGSNCCISKVSCSCKNGFPTRKSLHHSQRENAGVANPVMNLAGEVHEEVKQGLVVVRMVMPYVANHAQQVNANNANAVNPVMN